jgi:hypothetical protein
MNFATHNTIYSAKEMILKQTTHSKWNLSLKCGGGDHPTSR